MTEKNSLQFYYCGYEKCKPQHSFGPVVRVHYLLHFILNGKGSYQVRGKTYSVCKNQVFLIRPQEVTFYEADDSNPWEYLWFAFDGTEADNLINSFFPYENTYVNTAKDCGKLQAFFRAALPSFQSGLCTQEELCGWAYLFFSCLQHKADSQCKNNEGKYLSAALNYISYNYMTDINIDEISIYLGIDRTYLYKIVKKYTNCSPKEYLTSRRISAAKDMLEYSQYSITDVALACGFHDSSAFPKTFRSYENKTPSEYRRNVRVAATVQDSGNHRKPIIRK